MAEKTFTTQLLAELRAAVPISSVVGQHVRLTKAGNEFKGLCPFHQENSPSFYVNDQKAFYHCFGCGAHGDVIRFLTDARGISFADAVRHLAEKAEVPAREIASDEAVETFDPDPVSQVSADTDTPSRSRRGGRLNRSDTVTVRFDPTLNYLSELAARAQRRTKSSFIEWAVEQALRHVKVEGTQSPFDDDLRSVAHLAPDLWDVDESDRLAKLAFHAPALLTHEEQVIWKLIKENGLLWLGGYSPHNDEWTWQVRPENLRWTTLRTYWDTFKAVAAGSKPRAALPTWRQKRDDTDLDIPF